MKITSVVDVKTHLSAYLDLCRKSPILITRNGRPKALLLSVPENEEDLERFLLAHNPRFQEILKESELSIRETGGIEHKDFWSQIHRPEAKVKHRSPREPRKRRHR